MYLQFVSFTSSLHESPLALFLVQLLLFHLQIPNCYGHIKWEL